MKTFLPSFENLEERQLDGLKWTVNHAYRGSETYREKFDALNLKPGDIRSLEDLKRLPFTSAEDLSEGYPFPLLSVPIQDVVRIHTSSGTTENGKYFVILKKTLRIGPIFLPVVLRRQVFRQTIVCRLLWAMDPGQQEQVFKRHVNPLVPWSFLLVPSTLKRK